MKRIGIEMHSFDVQMLIDGSDYADRKDFENGLCRSAGAQEMCFLGLLINIWHLWYQRYKAP